ncbi:MAG: hypothetical protein LKG27_00410 [Clostridiaceae bacterium]|jgi:hypothetical protein|nr:hypothetical protein [Clostridiaceae bacterium]
MAFNVDGVNGIKFGQTTGIKAQQADNKIGTIGFHFANNPERMQAADKFVTGLAENGNGQIKSEGFLRKQDVLYMNFAE